MLTYAEILKAVMAKAPRARKLVLPRPIEEVLPEDADSDESEQPTRRGRSREFDKRVTTASELNVPRR